MKCRRTTGSRRGWTNDSGQSMSEYLVLAGVTTAITIMMVNMLGVHIRDAFRSVSERVLQVVTGYP